MESDAFRYAQTIEKKNTCLAIWYKTNHYSWRAFRLLNLCLTIHCNTWGNCQVLRGISRAERSARFLPAFVVRCSVARSGAINSLEEMLGRAG
jgi:hypothetical protein